MIEAMVDFTGGVGRTFDLQVIREIDLFQINSIRFNCSCLLENLFC